MPPTITAFFFDDDFHHGKGRTCSPFLRPQRRSNPKRSPNTVPISDRHGFATQTVQGTNQGPFSLVGYVRLMGPTNKGIRSGHVSPRDKNTTLSLIPSSKDVAIS